MTQSHTSRTGGPLDGMVALVTGASRGVGKGIALGLGEAGATVIVTGRTTDAGAGPLPGTIGETADAVSALGGVGVAIRCDHRDDAQTRRVLETVRRDYGPLDILVNNAWGGYEHFSDGTDFMRERGFWDAPLARWDSMFSAGVRTQYVTSALAAPGMIDRRRGLIVNVSFFAAERVDRGVAYATAKRATDHMTACMAHELREHKVAAVALYPGLVRTESVLKAGFDLANSESPQFVGRVVAALAADPDILRRSGDVLVAAQVALEYGITDLDGSQPRPLTVADI